MDTETHHTIAATMAAHERVLVFLLSDYLCRLSPAQRMVIDATLLSEESLLNLPPGLNLDIDQADNLAGLAIAYRDAMKRIFAASNGIGDVLGGEATR